MRRKKLEDKKKIITYITIRQETVNPDMTEKKTVENSGIIPSETVPLTIDNTSSSNAIM